MTIAWVLDIEHPGKKANCKDGYRRIYHGDGWEDALRIASAAAHKLVAKEQAKGTSRSAMRDRFHVLCDGQIYSSFCED